MAILAERAGRLELELAGEETGLLRDLIGRIDTLLIEPTDEPAADPGAAAHSRPTPLDPVLARLLPDAHRDDPGVAAAHRDLTEASLRQDKRADAAVVLAALPAAAGTAVIDDVDAWLRALNDVRLMLGVELDITEDTEPPRRITDRRGMQLTVYFWLTQLQDSLVETALA